MPKQKRPHDKIKTKNVHEMIVFADCDHSQHNQSLSACQNKKTTPTPKKQQHKFNSEQSQL